MGPYSQQVRQEAARMYESGKQLTIISQELGVSYKTIRNWIKFYRQKGSEGLLPDYSECGRKQKYSQALIDSAVEYKRNHPDWGAGFIRLKLEDKYPGETLPHVRQLQNYFKQYNVQVQKSKLPKSKGDWAEKPFDRVQVDAKEQLRTLDGKPCCYLNFTDEYTGSDLDAFVFPLFKNK